MRGAERDQAPGELQHLLVDVVPVDPGQLRVVAVGVVVAVLGAAQLVAVRDHRYALGEQQRRHEVAPLPGPQREDLRVVGRPFDTAVPRAVVVLAVAVVLGVGLVVLLVVGDQVRQREAVVAGDEVDAGDRPAAVVLVQVGRPAQAAGELGQRGRRTVPEVPGGVPEPAVPLRPQWREVADLVPARPDVPRFRDQLDGADHRVLLYHFEERRQPVHLVELAGQGGGEVEAEPVDVHLVHPVPQRVHDELQRVRAAHVEAVTGTGVVHVERGVLLVEPVVLRVVDAPEAQRRAEVVALGGVVVDHVEDDLDPGRVQRLDHGAELLHLLAPDRRVRLVRREEPDRVVAPVVAQSALDQPVVVDELVHRHQLDRGDAELLQVLDHRRVPDRAVGAAQFLGDARVPHRQTLDVRLVDDRVVVRDPRQRVVAPVEVRVDHDALGHEPGRVAGGHPVRAVQLVAVQRRVPLDLPVDRLRVWVEQQLVRVEPVPAARLVPPVHPVPVPLAGLDAGQVPVPDERVDLVQLDAPFLTVGVEQAQLDAVSGL